MVIFQQTCFRSLETTLLRWLCLSLSNHCALLNKKTRTRMYSRSWTTSPNLCKRKTNFFLHASCAHIVSAKAPEQQFTKRQLTSTTTTSPDEITTSGQRTNITSAMKSQRNHQRNEITSATQSPAQKHHQRNEITSTTKAPAQKNHQRTAPAQQNHQNKRNH